MMLTVYTGGEDLLHGIESLLVQNLPPERNLSIVAHVYDEGLRFERYGSFRMLLWNSKENHIGIGFSNPDPTPFYIGKISWSWGGGQKKYRFAIVQNNRFIVRKDIPTKREKGWHEFSLHIDYLFQTVDACVDSACVGATFPVRDRFSQLIFAAINMSVFLDDILISCYNP